MKSIQLDDNYLLDSGSVAFKREKLKDVLGKTLWTNSNPNSPISVATNISLNSSNYDLLEIVWRLSTENNLMISNRFLRGYGTRLYFGTSYRNITRNSDTSYTIQTSSDGSHQNGIPLYIIGYKTGLF